MLVVLHNDDDTSSKLLFVSCWVESYCRTVRGCHVLAERWSRPNKTAEDKRSTSVTVGSGHGVRVNTA